jgi:[acyl-carrier-protein] S-malonyltransferase
LTQPVLWQGCIERMMGDGVERFIEIGPGRILTGLLKKISRQTPVVNISTAESLAAMKAQNN